jgi:hypothetical protein
MPKPSPKTKLRPQPNVLLEASVRRMLAHPPQPKRAVKKSASKKAKKGTK